MDHKKRNRKDSSTTGKLTNPVIILVGDGPRVDEVKASLGYVKAEVKTLSPSSDIENRVDEDITAIVLIAPMKKSTLAHIVQGIRNNNDGKQYTIFAIVGTKASRTEVRQIYLAGAGAVFDWPREKDVFPMCLVEMIAVDFVRGRATKPDTALARTIRAHLKASFRFFHDIKVRVVRGVADLQGTVGHLWQKQRIEQAAAMVPGVKSVVVRGVLVDASGESDKSIAAKVKRLLRDTSRIDEKTLGIRVENGYLTLAGTVSDRSEVNRLTELLANIAGVRGIKKLLVVSREQTQRDSSIARRIQNTVEKLFPEENVEVSFFGDAAVLAGTSSSLAVKNRIKSIVDDSRFVNRTINKLEVL